MRAYIDKAPLFTPLYGNPYLVKSAERTDPNACRRVERQPLRLHPETKTCARLDARSHKMSYEAQSGPDPAGGGSRIRATLTLGRQQGLREPRSANSVDVLASAVGNQTMGIKLKQITPYIS